MNGRGLIDRFKALIFSLILGKSYSIDSTLAFYTDKEFCFWFYSVLDYF